MNRFVEKYFWPKPQPVTYKDVEPADRDPVKEEEVKSVLGELTEAVLRSANRSIKIKERLAHETIQIVTRGR
jgi:hypothetical protein